VSTQPSPRPLPERPNLRHLKDQARDLYKSGGADSLTQAQFRVAREYGFASWARLKAHVESLDRAGQLKAAIDDNDADRVFRLMTADPELHRTPIIPKGDLPLTYVARCQPSRLEIAEWMLANGSDVHQDDESALGAALSPDRQPILKLLVAHGANLDARAWGWFPLLFFPVENLDPVRLKLMLDLGANPDCPRSDGGEAETALDYACRIYVRRQHDLTACIDLLLAAGGTTQFDVPVVMDLLRNHLDSFAERLAADPSLVSARFSQLAFGVTGGRLLQLRGATLLHVAAEYQNLDAVMLLLDRGADVNARATVDDNGVGGQTPIFHSATQFSDNGLPVTRLLVARGADLSVRARVPGHYERDGEIVECTALGYALHLEEVTQKPKTIAFLRDHGATE
jgi:hypothetical protein